jgi:hypothetical protein
MAGEFFYLSDKLLVDDWILTWLTQCLLDERQ